MHEPLADAAARAHGTLHVRLADTDVLVQAPSCVLNPLDLILRYVPRDWQSNADPVLVRMQQSRFGWRLTSPGIDLMTVGGDRPEPEVARVLLDFMMRAASKHSQKLFVPAAVVEREGRAVAFVGSDHRTSLAVAAHLSMRGWQWLSGNYAIVDPASLTIEPFRAKFAVVASMVARMPLQYRRAVEASPWYAVERDLAFYAVDPARCDAIPVWSDGAIVVAAIIVDGEVRDGGLIHDVGSALPGAFGSRQSDRENRTPRLGRLALGSMVDSCDAVEEWLACCV